MIPRSVALVALLFYCSSCTSSDAATADAGDEALWLVATEARAMGTADRRIEVYADGRFVCSTSASNAGSRKSEGRLTSRNLSAVRHDVERLFSKFPNGSSTASADANIMVLAIASPHQKQIEVRPEEAELHREIREFVEVWNRIAHATSCRQLRAPR